MITITKILVMACVVLFFISSACYSTLCVAAIDFLALWMLLLFYAQRCELFVFSAIGMFTSIMLSGFIVCRHFLGPRKL